MSKYNESLNTLATLKHNDAILENLTEKDIEVSETLNDILESEVLFIESPTGDTLVLSDEMNSDLFEAVGASVLATLNEDEDSEEDDSEEDEDKKKEEDEEDSEEDEDKNESLTLEDAQDIKEALVAMIPEKSYTIKSESGSSLVVHEGSLAHQMIGMAMFEKLSGLCEATEDTTTLENFLAEQSFSEKKGLSTIKV